MTYPSIMKARKTMKNQALIQEVASQISQRFIPKIPDIKKVCFRLRSLLKAQNS
jgi:cullin 1